GPGGPGVPQGPNVQISKSGGPQGPGGGAVGGVQGGGQMRPQDGPVADGVGGRPIATPQRVPAPGENVDGSAKPVGAKKNRVLILAGAAVLAVIAVVVAVVALVANSSGSSPEAQVKSAITSYTDGLATGDLEKLRGVTCGAQHDFYQNISADQFAGVYRTSKEQKSIPVVKSVDAIRITGDTALAQATVYTEADPSKASARTFDLQRTSDGWKVCDPTNGQH
ncbi:Rv0361 family membrane protein, partial [Nocardia acidivorans]|uniref:Rv0361 family membrane protein n=1 Tax=Nocardia acidivorans TaxID=404580 RepID=UPI000AB7DCCF